MKKQSKKFYAISGIFLFAFILWTVLISLIDVRAIGPKNSEVGFSSLNNCFHKLTGVHFWMYDLTDLLSILPLAVIAFFGLMGLIQWIKRKNILKIDFNILVLGGFYVVVMAFFIFFEIFVINYRPVLIENVLEASYPSSTTMLVMCVMPTAMMQFYHRITRKALRSTVLIILGLFTAFMVIFRLISGVHWLTDIVGGALLSISLVFAYHATCKLK